MVVNHFDIIVIGGGAAGLMAAGKAASRGQKVLLLEKNRKLGEKLAITGGGRSNVTNAEPDVKELLSHYGEAEQFLYSAFTEFGMNDTFTFFEGRGLPLKVEARKRAFPKSKKASEVVKVLTNYCKEGKVQLNLGEPVKRIVSKSNKIEKIVTEKGEYSANAYILATGGVSHPETGSTGDGFSWLKDLKHTVVDPTPTIVPLRAKDSWIHALAGKSLPGAKITFYQGEKKQFAATGDLLLTHFGLSGPTILNSAGQVADLLHSGQVKATIDLFPTLDIGSLDSKLVEYFDGNKNKLLRNAAREFLPPGTTDALLALVPSVDPEKKVHSITKEERRALIDTFKSLPVNITGLMGFDRAVVADGGVPLTEIDMRTMRSSKVTNLFIVGDLLHITRPSGGYSLQLCWTTGFVAGQNA